VIPRLLLGRDRSGWRTARLAEQADGADVVTIEGLTESKEIADLQQKFVERNALQCGYCTPGMIMAASQILERNPNPSEEEIRHGLEGNLCRCTGYQHIVNAVQHAAKKSKAKAA